MMKNIWKKLPDGFINEPRWVLFDEIEDTRSNLKLCIIVSLIIIVSQIINYYF